MSQNSTEAETPLKTIYFYPSIKYVETLHIWSGKQVSDEPSVLAVFDKSLTANERWHVLVVLRTCNAGSARTPQRQGRSGNTGNVGQGSA